MITEGTPCPHHPPRPYDAGSRWRPVPEHWSCWVGPASRTPPARSTDSVETGWSTVVDADQGAVGPDTTSRDSQARDARDCPDKADPSQSGPSQSEPGQDGPSQSAPEPGG